LFLVSSRSNHISGKLIHISDDWRRLESSTLSHAIFSLRPPHPLLAACPEATATAPSNAPLVSEPRTLLLNRDRCY